MTNLQLEEVKKRSVTGILALTSRTGLMQLISSVGFFLLTIFLDLKIFGIYVVVQAASGFLNYFSDIGLAGALIQKKEAITDKDLSSTFTVQQILVLLISGVAFLFTNRIAGIYDLSSRGVTLFHVLILSFIISSLKTIPSILLERKLEFNKLIIPQILEVLAFYILAIIFAWQGMGIQSLTAAILGRAVVGLIAIYAISPWMPRIGFDKDSLRGLLSFGVPLQLNSILGLVKDNLFTLFLGSILPFESLSFIGWAKKWAETPLRLIMDSFIKVTFPTYSRLQRHKDKLTAGINKTAFFSALFIFPMAIGLMLLIEPLIRIIPKYTKWEPALFSFYLFVGAAVISSISTPLTNALNAIGRIKVTLKLMVMWTAFTWTLTPLLVKFIGFNGVALSALLIGGTVFIVVRVSKKYISFSLLANIFPPLAGTAVMGLTGLLLKGSLTDSFPGIVFYIVLLAAVYFGVLLLFFRDKFLSEVKGVLEVIKQ